MHEHIVARRTRGSSLDYPAQRLRTRTAAIGLFVIASFAGSYFYSWCPIITCAIGLVLIAAILNAFNGGMGGGS